MPLILIYHPEDAFTTPESKEALAKSITSYYTNPTSPNLPPFYVVVNFILMPPGTTFIGGVSTSATTTDKKSKPFIRFAIDNIAVRLPDQDEVHAHAVAQFDAVLKPHVADRGYDWEYHFTETDRRLWKINGIAPPPWHSAAEAVWREQNRPVPLEEL